MRLLVDISGLAYRSAFKLNLSDRSGVPTHVVFGTLRSLQHLAELVEPEEMIICWDSGHEARSRLYPEYKGNRKRDKEFKEDFDRQMGVLREVLGHLPVTNISEPGVEADDCIAALASFMRPEHVAIVTGDQDLYQLASGPAHVAQHEGWKGGRHIILDYDGVPVKLEFKPLQYVTYKVLVGDSSDNVKGVLGLGDKRARALLQEHGTLKRIMRWAKAAPKEKRLGRMTYAEAAPIVKRNLQLINLDGTPMLTKDQRWRVVDSYRKARLDRRVKDKELREHFTRLGFKSILRKFTRFVTAFKGMERISNTVKAEAHAEEEVHQADQEGRQEGRQWRRIRKVKGASDHRAGGGRQPADPHYIRRVRKVKDPHPPARRRWRRIRRVVAAHDRARGGDGGGDDGEGDPALAVDGGAGSTAQLDPPGRHRGASRAVPSVVRQARARRGGRAAAELSHLQEVLHSESVRRDRALSVLSSLRTALDNPEDIAWLKQQSDADLKHLVRIIRWFERDETYTPSEEDAAFLEELGYRKGMEMPDWMLTEDEQDEREESIAIGDLGYWDFASNAIANIGRRRKR